MQTIFDIVFPVFGLIAIGYLTASVGLLSEASGQALARFVFVVAVPVLLFRSLSQASFGAGNPLVLWAVYFGAVAIAWTTGTLLIRWISRTDHRTGVIAGITSSFANTVFVALPTIQQAYGDVGLEPLLLILAVHLPIMMTVSTLMVERAVLLDDREKAGGEGVRTIDVRAAMGRVARNLSTNSIVVGILAGLLWRLTGWPLETHLDVLSRQIAATAGPLALFSLGMSLTRYGLRGDLVSAATISVLSLVVQPAIVWLAAFELGLSGLWLDVAVLTAAAPAGVNAYLFANYFGTGEKLAATAILLSTILSVFTLSFWIAVLGAV